MKRYEAYKAVQPLWNMTFPKHWEVFPLYSIAKEKSICNCTELELLSVYLDAGVVPFSKRTEKRTNATSKDLSKYQRVDPGDFVLNNQQAWRGSVGVSKHTGITSPAYIVLSMNDQLTTEYANYLFRSAIMVDQYLVRSKGVGSIQRNLYWQELKCASVLVPPRDEQDQIVRYLDWQVSKINHLIHGYQKQINLLDERKTTVINQAVTRGIHADVEMQAVEANWVKEIPAHWQFNKVKQHFEIKKRIAGKEGYDVISITQQGLKVKDIASNEGQMAANYSKYQFVYPGDYAMNHMDLLTGFIGLSDFFGVTSPDYRVFSAIDVERTDLKYFLYVFQLGYKRKIFYGLGRGAANKGRWRMPAINFKNYDIPVPPIEEQREIVEYIEQETEKIDLLKKEVEKHIEYLREYRTRLIADVVTGQIDVRDVVIPEYTPEEDTEIDTNDTGEDVEEVAEDAE